jgi:protease I
VNLAAEAGRSLAARRLRWDLVDKSLINAVAEKIHVGENVVGQLQGRTSWWMERIARAVWLETGGTTVDLVDAENVHEFTAQAIQEAADRGKCVIVGRGAQCVLRDRSEALHVFLFAPLEHRMRRLQSRYSNGKELIAAMARGGRRACSVYQGVPRRRLEGSNALSLVDQRRCWSGTRSRHDRQRGELLKVKIHGGRMEKTGLAVLVLVETGFNEIETMYAKYRLEEAGYRVFLTAPKSGEKYLGRYGYPCTSEMSVYDVHERHYAGVIIAGGLAPSKLRTEGTVKSLVAEMFRAGKLVGTICTGGSVLISAGICKGLRMAGSPSIVDDLKNAGATVEQDTVVIDRGVVTSGSTKGLPLFMLGALEVLGAGVRRQEPVTSRV